MIPWYQVALLVAGGAGAAAGNVALGVLANRLDDGLVKWWQARLRKTETRGTPQDQALRELAEAIREKRQDPGITDEAAADLYRFEGVVRSLDENATKLTASVSTLPPNYQGGIAQGVVSDLLRHAKQQTPDARETRGADLASMVLPVTPPKPVGDLIGKHLSGYTLKAILGEGGFGVVYLGENRIGRKVKKVAIKVPHYGAQIETVLKEAEALFDLQHENIVRLENANRHVDPPHLVCEYVDGESLRDILEKQGPLSEKRVAAILRDVLDALEHAQRSRRIR